MQRLYSTARRLRPWYRPGRRPSAALKKQFARASRIGELETYAALTQKLLEHIDRLSQELSR